MSSRLQQLIPELLDLLLYQHLLCYCLAAIGQVMGRERKRKTVRDGLVQLINKVFLIVYYM
eukprot:scaffold3079_cov187-Ochromonas_danica.AAC.13